MSLIMIKMMSLPVRETMKDKTTSEKEIEEEGKAGAGNPLGVIPENLFLGRLFSLLVAPERLTVKEYAEKYRWLDSQVSAFPGKIDCYKTPYMLLYLQYLEDINIRVIVGMKSAQIGWSEIQNSYISRHIDTDPQNIIMAFPRAASAHSYSREKIRPMIKSNPRLLSLIGNPDNCSYDFYKFPGGFLKLVTAGSPTALKSSSAPILIVEEPDDLQDDLKRQGAALEIFVERQKSYEERKLIYGGTPSEAGFSKIALAYEQSNQMRFYAHCPKCSEEHILGFDNLKYDKYPAGKIDKVYGRNNPFSAYYCCPHCSDVWDTQKKDAIILNSIKYNQLGWKAHAKSHICGFAFNELMSNFPGSSLVNLALKKLQAEQEAEKGKVGKLKAFVNNSMGEAYASSSINITLDQLKDTRKDYPELLVPMGGIILTAGVDVQHNRFAIVVRAWGRNGNSWLIYWGEIYGYVKDPEDSVWTALTAFYKRRIPHALSTVDAPVSLPISALSIDSSDGNTTQLVYNWVRLMGEFNRYTYATKGSSDVGALKKEIFTVPTDPDAHTRKAQRKKLAETYGVNVFIVGAQLAKDEVLRKLTLTGAKDRSFHYKGVREDYEEQLLSNTKKVNPRGNNIRYELTFGKRDEALDCEVLALHANRALRLQLWSPRLWTEAEAVIGNKKLLRELASERKKSRVGVTRGIN